MDKKRILSVNNLDKYFVKSGKLVKVLDDINFDVYEKDFFGIIGESGSGKSTTGKCIIRLYSSTSGVINFNDNIINKKSLTKEEKKDLCQNMSMIFQDPMASLNPRKTVLSIIAEPLMINNVIKNEVKEIMETSLKINNYFSNTFKWQDYNLNQRYLLPFYDNAISLFKKACEELQQFLIISPTNDQKVTIMNFLSILITYESKYKSLIPQIYELNSLTKELVQYNHSRLENRLTHIEESNYYAARKAYKEKQKLMYAPEKYWDLKKEKDEIESQLQGLIDSITDGSFKGSKGFLKATINSLTSEMNIYKQNKRLTTSLSEYNVLKVKLLIIKEILDIFDGIDDSLFISGNELESFLNFITSKVNEKYRDLLMQSMKLEEIGDFIDTLTLDKNSKEDIIRVLSIYRDLYFRISNEMETIYESNKVNDMNEVQMVKSHLFDKADYIDREFNKKVMFYKKLIANLQNQMDQIRKEYIGSGEYLTNQRIIELASQELEEKKEVKDAFARRSNDIFYTKVIPLINEQNSLIKHKQSEFIAAQKQYIKQVNQAKRELIKIFKKADGQNNEERKYWIDFLKREVSSKENNIKAINFELRTYLDEIDIFKGIRVSSKSRIKLYYKALKMIVTRQHVYKALNEVGLKNEHSYRYPHEFSGGQRQRIVIARALIMKPKLIIADEPISALDVSIQAQVINIMKKLSNDMDITFLFIAHDLSMIRYVSNRLIIMHKGRIVEKGDTKDIFKNPVHPYTKSLIKASPELRKIHIDLASFSTNIDYDKDYGKGENLPSFHSVSNNVEHFVFGTRDQIKKWVK